MMSDERPSSGRRLGAGNNSGGLNRPGPGNVSGGLNRPGAAQGGHTLHHIHPLVVGRRGNVLSEAEAIRQWDRQGMCTRCGGVKTHERQLFSKKPITKKGQVYKGYCLQCYTLYDAMEILGEDTTKLLEEEQNKKREETKRKNRFRRGRTRTPGGAGAKGKVVKAAPLPIASPPSGPSNPAAAAAAAPAPAPVDNNAAEHTPALQPWQEGYDAQRLVGDDDETIGGPAPPIRVVNPSLQRSDSVSTLGTTSQSIRQIGAMGLNVDQVFPLVKNNADNDETQQGHHSFGSSSPHPPDSSPAVSTEILSPSRSPNSHHDVSPVQSDGRRWGGQKKEATTPHTTPGVANPSPTPTHSTTMTARVREAKRRMPLPLVNEDERINHYGGSGGELRVPGDLRPPFLPTPSEEKIGEDEEYGTHSDSSMGSSSHEDAGVDGDDAVLAAAIKEIRYFASQGDYRFVVQTMRANPSWAKVATIGCIEIREGMVRDRLSSRSLQRDRSDASHQALPAAWVKVIAMSMSEHAGDVTVQTEAIRTIWMVTTLASRFKSDLVECGGLDAIVHAMKRHPNVADIQMYGAGAISSVSASEAHVLPVKRTNGLVERLLHALKLSSSGSVSAETVASACELSLRSAYNLVAADPEGGSVADQIVASKGDGNGINDIVASMKMHKSSPGVQEWGCRLLWLLTCGDAARVGDDSSSEHKSSSEMNGIVPSQCLTPSVELVNVIVDGMSCNVSDLGAQEAAAGLLSNLAAMPQTSKSPQISRDVVEVTVQYMGKFPDSAALQHYGSMTLSNLCCSPAPSSMIKELQNLIVFFGGVTHIIKAMRNHHNNAEVVGEGCLILACLCVGAPWNKDAIIQAGGIDAAVRAYRSGLGTATPEAALLRERACLAISSLAVNPEGLNSLNESTFIRDLIKSFVDAKRLSGLEVEGGDTTRGWDSRAQLAMRNILAMNSNGENAELHNFTVSTVVKFMMQDRKEPEIAEDAIAILDCLAAKSRECVKIILGTVAAMKNIIETLTLNLDNAAIQERGCRLLSNIYKFWESSDGPIGSTQEVEVIVSAMRRHRTSADVQSSACLALRNMCEVSTFVVRSEADAIISKMTEAVGDIIEAMRENINSPSAQEAFCSLLWAMADRDRDAATAIASAGSISCIIEALLRFPNRELLQVEAMGILMVLSLIPDTLQSIGTDDGIEGIVVAMDQYAENEKIVENGCIVLSMVSADKYQTRLAAVENEKCLGCIVGGMYSFPRSATIQEAACAAISNLSIDMDVIEDVTSAGGIDRIQNAMQIHDGVSSLVEKACDALFHLIPGVANNILFGNEITQRVMTAMQRHIDVVEVQEKALAALWQLSVKDPGNKHQIARFRGIPLVIESMKEHISSERVQERGCVALWSLAMNDDNKAQIGEEGGVEAIITGMSAHITRTHVQHEALGAIKALATNARNKEYLRANDAVSAILNTMWVHSDDASIQESAFTALTNIAVDPVTNRVTEMRDAELEAIISAMRRFPDEQGVQVQACILIRNYTFAPENMPKIRAKPDLFELLQRAGDVFPHACGERANYILGSL